MFTSKASFKKILLHLTLLSIPLSPLTALNPTPGKVRTLYCSLDPHSIAEHLAFYHLYSNRPEGKRALQDAWILLTGNEKGTIGKVSQIPNLPQSIQGIINIVAAKPGDEIVSLTEQELSFIEALSHRLANRQLKGASSTVEAEVLSLPSEEIDLARGLLLSQLDPSSTRMHTIRSYEAMIDLMALQILAKLPNNATSAMKVRAINQFVFEEMGFCFPPHSLYAKDVDLYTFLPSVLDSRKGVCLGVSILYLAIAQRLNLPLEMITPPGHIYVRFRDGTQTINIETTARGINMNSEAYLGIDTRSLQQRTIKEVIGLAHYNHASVFWKENDYEKALASYKKAKHYLPDDQLLIELMGYNYLFAGNKENGIEYLEKIKDYVPDYAVAKETMAEDFLHHDVDIEGLKTFFLPVDETRESILEKKQSLEEVIAKFPKFRAGIFAIASAWLQLNREGEALSMLERYHRLDPNDPTVEYYLSVLYTERQNYVQAWKHLLQAERLTLAREHNPKVLKALRKELTLLCPE